VLLFDLFDELLYGLDVELNCLSPYADGAEVGIGERVGGRGGCFEFAALTGVVDLGRGAGVG
jgi:hypothetical protein